MRACVIDAYNTLSHARTIPAAGAHERDSRAPAHQLLPPSPFRLAIPPIYQRWAIVSELTEISYRPRVFVAGNAACLRLSVRGMGLMQGRCFLRSICMRVWSLALARACLFVWPQILARMYANEIVVDVVRYTCTHCEKPWTHEARWRQSPTRQTVWHRPLARVPLHAVIFESPPAKSHENVFISEELFFLTPSSTCDYPMSSRGLFGKVNASPAPRWGRTACVGYLPVLCGDGGKTVRLHWSEFDIIETTFGLTRTIRRFHFGLT